ncbi:MAG: hypothetical protein HON04_04495 [Planctomicrobium sp.]|nr:hypothetical protein [Planctomicrobium sp.]
MASDSSGYGQVFWQEQGVNPPFIAARSQRFDVQHDGNMYNYSVPLSAMQPVLAVRIDPSRAGGKIKITDVSLKTADGTVIRKWSF